MKLIRKYNFAKAQNPQVGVVQEFKIKMATVETVRYNEKNVKLKNVKLN
jgi:hypothetical protein